MTFPRRHLLLLFGGVLERARPMTKRLEPSPRAGAAPGMSNRYLVGSICAFLALAVLVVFAQTSRHAFVNFDDDLYV